MSINSNTLLCKLVFESVLFLFVFVILMYLVHTTSDCALAQINIVPIRALKQSLLALSCRCRLTDYHTQSLQELI